MIASKVDYYAKYHRHYFGNRPRYWRTWEEFIVALASFNPPKPPFMLRSNKPGGPTVSGSHYVSEVMFDNGTVSEQTDDSRIIIQGEYLPPFDLTYTRVKKPMKDAFRDCVIHEHSPLVRLKMKEFMCPEAVEMVDWLIDEHGQDHVLEFSVYDGPVGNLGWNTVIWECRRY
jgi:hypothetical protein